jgi:hypothetical protein
LLERSSATRPDRDIHGFALLNERAFNCGVFRSIADLKNAIKAQSRPAMPIPLDQAANEILQHATLLANG